MSEERTVKLLRNCVAGGEDHKKGDTVTVSARDAHALLCMGMAEEEVEKKKKKDKI